MIAISEVHTGTARIALGNMMPAMSAAPVNCRRCRRRGLFVLFIQAWM